MEINLLNLLVLTLLQSISAITKALKRKKIERDAFDISQAITEGSFETRSKEKTLFFTFFSRRASGETRHSSMI